MRKLAFVSLLSLSAIAAHAAVLWDQGPSQGSYVGAWSQTTGAQELVDSFMLGQDSMIADYHYYSSFDTLGGTNFHFALYADAGNTPGALLMSFDDDYDSFGSAGTLSGVPIYRADFTFSPFAVSGGTKYWIGVTANGFEGAVVSSTGSAMGDGVLAFRSGTGGWNVINSIGDVTMEITGTAVPEPASMIALGVGALALIRRRNRK